MTKTTLALAAVLIAASTMMTNAANAGGIRVGFGFPLGSFVAHPNQNYSDGAYERQCEKERARRYEANREVAAAAAARRAQAAKVQVAQNTPAETPVATVAKLDSKLPADTANTTVLAKTSDTSTDSKPDSATLSASETTDGSKVATSESTDEKADANKEPVSDGKKVCRRFSPAIAALVDVPCE